MLIERVMWQAAHHIALAKFARDSYHKLRGCRVLPWQLEVIMIRVLSCRRVFAILFLAAFVCARVAADEPKKGLPTKEQIAQWVMDLGNDEFAKRENASKQLWLAGRLAEAALKEALKSDDLEVKRRSHELFSKFKWGIYPDTPAKIVEMVQRYQSGTDVKVQGAIVLELLDEGGGRPCCLRQDLGS
jgi:hypothetical protein